MASMSELIDELVQIESELRSFVEKSKRPEIAGPLQKLEDIAEEFGKSWSGSPLGYHANVYYLDFQPPPPNAHFDIERGLKWSRGDWRRCDPEQVHNLIHEKAGSPNLKIAHELGDEGEHLFDEKRSEIVSILQTALTIQQQDPFLNGLREKADRLKISTALDYVRSLSQGRFISSEPLILSDPRLRVAAHISVLAEVYSVEDPSDKCNSLADTAKRAVSHLRRIGRSMKGSEMIGTNVFIGHGGSLIWLQLKDFIEGRLKLPWDEFDRSSAAGYTVVERLSEMLDAAVFAFLILTGEDGQSDGAMNPRMNVVHEAGLFQGRLGFKRAIILLEDGCEEFSNIHGLVQIRFPKGNIKASFEEIRRVLEREGVIGT